MTLLKGNCLETLKTLETASVDSIVTDPPYELGFMGKSWDNSGIAYNQDLWAECLRVLKPGGHLLAFGGSRTYHRLASAIEDSGFEIRDQIMWLYGSGFPKSMSVPKAIEATLTTGNANKSQFKKLRGEQVPRTDGNSFQKANAEHGNRPTDYSQTASETRLDTLDPTTDEAKQWQGWGTALKPAHEPIVVARKPLVGTVANNVLTYGTGAINIDGSRVGTNRPPTSAQPFTALRAMEGRTDLQKPTPDERTDVGRWPANVIHDGSDEVLAGFPITGASKSANRGLKNRGTHGGISDIGASPIRGTDGIRGHDDNGGSAARFFYCAKASKSERNAGLEESNTHPTVKPLALMRYLIKLVTPPNGIVLDPFLGSGTTAVAAILEGFEWIGCEMTEDYFPIIEARVEWAQNERNTEKATPTLFERGEKL
jgi:site-specific DNA-methyltransferase (adenine-specific)